MRLLMETRFDSLSADKLADLLKGLLPQTKALFDADVEMLRELLSSSAAAPSHGGEVPASTNTAVLWAAYRQNRRPFSARWLVSVDFRDRFVKHFGAILCKGSRQDNRLGGHIDTGTTGAFSGTATNLDSAPVGGRLGNCVLPPATSSLLAMNAFSVSDGQHVLRHVLEQLACGCVVDSMFASSSSSSSSSSSASVGSKLLKKLAALQLDELLRAERMSASCGDAANLGSRVCLHPEAEAATESEGSPLSFLLHSPWIASSH